MTTKGQHQLSFISLKILSRLGKGNCSTRSPGIAPRSSGTFRIRGAATHIVVIHLSDPVWHRLLTNYPGGVNNSRWFGASAGKGLSQRNRKQEKSEGKQHLGFFVDKRWGNLSTTYTQPACPRSAAMPPRMNVSNDPRIRVQSALAGVSIAAI